MILHELLKYPQIELAVGLELDQAVVRSSFKHFDTQPHFDDERVKWWFGDASKTLQILPDDYYGSFDLVVIDLLSYVVESLMVQDLNILDAAMQLLNPEGIISYNDDFVSRTHGDYAKYTVDLNFLDVPLICQTHVNIGSNGVDFFRADQYDHGIEAIKLWLDSLKDELPGDYPHEAILDALDVVMRNNLAEFGDCHFKQIRGTAMGTSVAVIYAGLYYGWHEKAKLLPTYSQFILDMSRFVDDMTVLWLGSHNDYLNFKRDVNNYGILKWTMEDPSNKAIFLDLDMTISEEGVISTRTFQKPMNLYLYIPPQSAHQDGLMKGIVYGELKRYLWQNTKRGDYIKMVSKFFQRCLKRNWPYKRLYRIFIDANRKLADSKSSQATQNATMSQEQHDNEGNKKRDRVFLKLKFHPNYIPRKKIRELYEEELEDVLRDQLGVNQFTICYSRAQNISDCVVRSRLHQAEGETVSTFLGGVT